MTISEIQTPCLLIDMDSFDFNLKRMANLIAPYNVSLRPHAKMHKSVDVAHQQLANGKATGICCQKVSEAEVFARAGITDILITNQVCDEVKIERLAGIASLGCRLSVCVDDKANIYALSEEAKRQNVEVHCLVELDCGAGRCGVTDTGQVIELATAIEASEHLIFDGLQAYQGSVQHELYYHQRKTKLDAVIAKVKQCLDDLAAVGWTALLSAAAAQELSLRQHLAYTQRFNVALMPLWMLVMVGYIIRTGIDLIGRLENALFLLTSIISTAKDGQAVCDAGLKVQSVDSGLPVIFGCEDVSYVACSDEHGVIEDRQNKLK